MRHAAVLLTAALAMVSAGADASTPSGLAAATTRAFLSSIGINLHVDQGYDPSSYVAPLRYTGIREARDGARHVDAEIMLHRETGVRFVVSSAGDLPGLLAAARTLAGAGALLALEGPNEPNNFPIHYQGQVGGGRGSWIAVARFQADLYAAVKSDPVLKRYPVFGVSETGAENDDVGLQFLAIPAGADTLLAAGTRLSDYANVHNYVSGNGSAYADNQAWDAADPTLNARWDGLYGNNGLTWHRHYSGYPDHALRTLHRVTTETGWDTTTNPGGEATQATILTNTYLAQFKRGWAYTFVYELRDGEGGPGHQGLYAGARPKLAATWLHNLTTLLAGGGPGAGRLPYTIPHQPATVHDLLLAAGRNRFDLIVWDERVHGQDKVSVVLPDTRSSIDIYDIARGTKPVRSLDGVSNIPLTLSDHAVVIKIED